MGFKKFSVRWFNSDNGQWLFEFFIRVFLVLIRIFLKLLLFFPFIAAGYFFTQLILQKTDHGILWMVMVYIFSVLFYRIFSIIKYSMFILRGKNNPIWFLIFLVSVFTTSVFPVWLVYDPIKNWVLKLAHSGADLITWIICGFLGWLLYRRHYR